MTTVPQSPIQEPVLIGDLFEMAGRIRTIWSVYRLLTLQGGETVAEMRQTNGLGKVTVTVDDLHMQVLFKKVRSDDLDH